MDESSHYEPGKLIWILPYRLDTPNIQMHWRSKHKKNKILKGLIAYSYPREIHNLSLPCLIKLTRISPRSLDYDNLCYSFKIFSDKICDILIPGKKPGHADGDSRIKIEYYQEKGKPKEFGVKIEITSI